MTSATQAKLESDLPKSGSTTDGAVHKDSADKSPDKVFQENNPWEKPPVKSERSVDNDDDGSADARRDSAGRKSIVTGNGFGYAVLAPNGELNKFYAHPYKFERPSADPTKDGVPTLNLIKSMSWKSPQSDFSPSALPQKIQYVSESNVMRVDAQGGQQQYYMPFGLQRNALITTFTGPESKPDVAPQLSQAWTKSVENEQQVEIAGRHVKWVTFKDSVESVAMVPLDETKNSNPISKSGEHGWAIISLENKDQLAPAVQDLNKWQNNLSPSELTDREIKAQNAWRVEPNVKFSSEEERRVWRQSETILRMGQIREENNDSRKNNGFINASLPDGEWFIPWVRDMSYAVNGLTEMGHTAEARKGLMAYFNAPPGQMQLETRGADYQVSVVRYYGNGQEEADHSGEKTPNVELDNWGLVLWTASEYFQKTHDQSFLNEKTQRGSVYESMRDYVVAPLIANLDKHGDGSIVIADSSLWEEHQENKKHFAFSTIMAIRGLRGFQTMAEAMHDREAVEKVSKTVTDLEKGFASAFVDKDTLRGSLEPSYSHEIDGALLEAFNFDVVKDPKILENTLSKMELLREPSGGFRRVRGETNYERQEFLMIDFYMSRLYFKLGRDKEGMELLNRMVKKADQDNGRVPEMYVSELNDEFTGPIGTPSGALPMVGYGAGAYVMTLEAREKAARKRELERSEGERAAGQ